MKKLAAFWILSLSLFAVAGSLRNFTPIPGGLIMDNLVGNWDALTGGYTIPSTTQISSWPSASGGPALTQGTLANRPDLDSGTTLSGVSTVKTQTSTVKYFALNSGGSKLTAFTFYAIVRPNATPTAFDSLVGFSGAGATGDLILYLNSTNRLAHWVNNVGNLGSSANNVFANNTWYRLCWTYDGATSNAYLDDMSTAVLTASTASRTGFGPTAVITNSTGFTGFNGNFAQIVLYSVAHTSAQRTKMKTYFERWH